MYWGYFTSSSVVSILFRLIEFNQDRDFLISYMLQVYKVNKYNMIIDSDIILHELNIDLLFTK